jgi:predicted transcriptional regulator
MSPSSHHKTELRGEVSHDLAQALDAIALSRDLTRHAFVVDVLEKEVRRIAHEQKVLARVTRGNPYFTDSSGGQPE